MAEGADNHGVSADVSTSPDGRGADFDGARNSYSAQALVAAGADRVLVDGVRLAWQAGTAGLDNMVAHGQDLLLDQASSGRHLLLLGAASNGPSTGRATVNYADGGRHAFELALDDWTLNAGRDAPRSVPVVKTSYRNRADGSREQMATYLFCVRVPIDPARKVLSVTLPSQVSAGRQHIFALQVAP
jgi:hypothetical protein